MDSIGIIDMARIDIVVSIVALFAKNPIELYRDENFSGVFHLGGDSDRDQLRLDGVGLM
jgi:hypothetical protein